VDAPEELQAGISVALSGGGHRAALFAVGALMGLVDAGVNQRVRVIASVSGGSITNGLLAKRGDFARATPESLSAWLAPGVATFDRDGLFFPGPRTDGFVKAFFLLVGATVSALVATLSAAVAIGQDVIWATGWLVAGIETAVLLVAVAAVKVVKRDLIRTSYVWPLLAGLLVTLLGAPLMVLGLVGAVVALVGLVVLAKVTVWWFGRRSAVVDAALDEGLFEKALLRDVDHPADGATSGGVHHIFCATNLTSGTQSYLSPRLVSGYGLGTGRPAATLRLSTAVQASAAFPGGFSARRLKVAQLLDTGQPVAEPSTLDADLVDGGVYDNMGDQWELGWRDRRDRVEKATPGFDFAGLGTEQCGALLVVNAGGHYGTGVLKGGGLRREVAVLMKDKSVMYDQTTAIKRRYLYDGFVRGRPLRGAIIQIAQTPRTVASSVRAGQAPPEMVARAAEATQLLDQLAAADPANASDAAWAATRDLNRDYPTVLSPIPVATAARLMWQAYVLTRINTYVLLGEGSLLPPGGGAPDLGPWSLKRFEDCAAGGSR
jgi:Patatin-like phospholipase